MVSRKRVVVVAAIAGVVHLGMLVCGVWGGLEAYTRYTKMVKEHEQGLPEYYPEFTGPERQRQVFYSAVAWGTFALFSLAALTILVLKPKLILGTISPWALLMLSTMGIFRGFRSGTEWQVALSTLFAIPFLLVIVWRMINHDKWELTGGKDESQAAPS